MVESAALMSDQDKPVTAQHPPPKNPRNKCYEGKGVTAAFDWLVAATGAKGQTPNHIM